MTATTKKSFRKVKKNEALWLLSFADLSMILISFFILMLSFTQIDKRKAELVVDAMRQNENSKTSQTSAVNLVTISNHLEEILKKLKLDKNTEVTIDSTGVSIEFKDGVLFDFGSAEPNPRFRQTVNKVMDLIAKTPARYQLKIEGHTDDTPVSGGKYPSNWELSSARGIALLRQFEGRGIESTRMAVVAYAHTRPKIATLHLKGEDLLRARSANRRVVIRIE